MLKYIFNRLLINIPTLLAILITVFVLINMAPGDPVDAFVPPNVALTQEQKELLRHELGLDQAAPIRFFVWVKQVASGDLGYRYKDGSKVLDEIKSRIVPTLMLACAGLTGGSLLGIMLGIFPRDATTAKPITPCPSSRIWRSPAQPSCSASWVCICFR